MAASPKIRASVADAPGTEPSGPGIRRIKVIIVGAGDELLMEIGPALSDRYHSYSVDTAGEIAALSATHWIGVFDASHHSEGRSAFAQLELQYPRQPWIAVCADDDRVNWRDVVARGSACAVIARSELGVSSIAVALDKAALRLTVVPRPVPSAARTHPVVPLLWVLGAAAVTVAAGAAWWMSHSRARAPALAVPQSQTLPPATGSPGAPVPANGGPGQQASPQSIEYLLSMARMAFRDPAAQLPKADVPPRGTSALELYGAVLMQQPTNKEALDGVRRLQAVARLRIQNALAVGDVTMAARLLAVLQHANLDPLELRTLQASVEGTQLKQLAAQAHGAITAGNLLVARQAIDQLVALHGEAAPVPELRRQLNGRRLEGELTIAADQVRAALTAGSLLEPRNDNARTRFLAMQDLSRTSPQTLAVQHDLLVALLRRAQVDIGREDFDGAQQILTVAQEMGTRNELAETRGNLEAALSSKRAGDAAAAAAAKAPRTVAAASSALPAAATILSPKPTRGMHVDFPPFALAANLQGYAIVEFTLNPNGGASAASVVESSPAGTFDSAALAAVRRATFSTQDLTDPKRPQRARFKINFTLADTPAPQTTVSTTAPTAVAAPPNPTQILSPKLTQPLQVDYPKVALALNRTGYVVVEFMLQPDGTAGSPMVIESLPVKVFDYEALLAVKRARFVTTDLADRTKAQRARVKINFKGQ